MIRELKVGGSNPPRPVMFQRGYESQELCSRTLLGPERGVGTRWSESFLLDFPPRPVFEQSSPGGFVPKLVTKCVGVQGSSLQMFLCSKVVV